MSYRPDCIVDTCIWIAEQRAPSQFELYAPYLAGKIIGVSFQTYAELITKPKDLQKYKRKFYEEGLATVLSPDEETCRLWATLVNTWIVNKRPKPYPAQDFWQAATALRYKVPLVTHNRKHFEDIPKLEVVSHVPEKRAG